MPRNWSPGSPPSWSSGSPGSGGDAPSRVPRTPSRACTTPKLREILVPRQNAPRHALHDFLAILGVTDAEDRTLTLLTVRSYETGLTVNGTLIETGTDSHRPVGGGTNKASVSVSSDARKIMKADRGTHAHDRNSCPLPLPRQTW